MLAAGQLHDDLVEADLPDDERSLVFAGLVGDGAQLERLALAAGAAQRRGDGRVVQGIEHRVEEFGRDRHAGAHGVDVAIGGDAAAFLFAHEPAFDEVADGLHPELVEVLLAELAPSPGAVEAHEDGAPRAVLPGDQQRALAVAVAQARVGVFDQHGVAGLGRAGGERPVDAGHRVPNGAVDRGVFVEAEHGVIAAGRRDAQRPLLGVGHHQRLDIQRRQLADAHRQHIADPPGARRIDKTRGELGPGHPQHPPRVIGQVRLDRLDPRLVELLGVRVEQHQHVVLEQLFLRGRQLLDDGVARLFHVGVHRLQPAAHIGGLVADQQVAEHAVLPRWSARDQQHAGLVAEHLDRGGFFVVGLQHLVVELGHADDEDVITGPLGLVLEADARRGGGVEGDVLAGDLDLGAAGAVGQHRPGQQIDRHDAAVVALGGDLGFDQERIFAEHAVGRPDLGDLEVARHGRIADADGVDRHVLAAGEVRGAQRVVALGVLAVGDHDDPGHGVARQRPQRFADRPGEVRRLPGRLKRRHRLADGQARGHRLVIARPGVR